MADAFDVLGLEPEFDLDPVTLERAYLVRAAHAHPDRAGGDPEASRLSASINEARRLLSDPESRANVLLARLGGPSKEQEKSLPSGFLAEMMEVREDIESAVAAGGEAERARREQSAGERRAAHARAVSGMFRALGPRPSSAALRAIRVELNAWRYTERLLEQLSAG